MGWRRDFTKQDAYGIITAGIMMLLLFPFIVSNYMPIIIFDIIGIGISITLISLGIFFLWKINNASK